MHFLIFLNLGVKCFFGHNFGSRHARRSSKGSNDAGDHLVSNKKFESKFRPIGLASKARQILSKKQKRPTFRAPPGEPLTQIKIKKKIEPRRLAASVEGLDNSLAIAASELSPKKHAPIYWLARSLKGWTAGPRYIRGCCLMLKRRYGFRAGA